MELRTKYPLREYGVGETYAWETEEGRTHTHIIGTTQVGKSTLMERMMHLDVNQGNGFTLLDSSENGDTSYRILRYCEKVGFKKVIFIDPRTALQRKRVLPIDPFGNYPDASANSIMEILQVQFQQKDRSETPVINQYLPAIIRTLHRAKASFYDAIYFTNHIYWSQREEIFRRAGENHDTYMLRDVWHNQPLYNEYRPTARRVLDLLHPYLKYTFGDIEGIDFYKFIRNGWVILANLYTSGGFSDMHARFLGTTILSEVNRAVDGLTAPPNPWKGRYYLYIDECGRFATRTVSDILTYKAKAGVRLILSHQDFGMMEDPVVVAAILNQTSTKYVFRMEDAEDRLRLAKQLYGGQVSDKDAAYYIGQLQKKECIVKFPGKKPATIRVHDVEQLEGDVTGFLDFIYSQPFYHDIDVIERRINERFPHVENRDTIGTTSHTPPKTGAKTSSKPTGTTPVPSGRVGMAPFKELSQERDKDVSTPETDGRKPKRQTTRKKSSD